MAWENSPISVVTPPASLVTAADAKLSAPVLVADSDARVTQLLQVAQAMLERSEIGRAFGEQTLSISNREFGCSVRLPFPPLRSVVSVKYVDPADAEQTLAASHYEVDGVGGKGCLRFVDVASLPAIRPSPGAVTITFVAGYPSASPDLLPVKQAIILGAVQGRALSTQDLAIRREEVDGVGGQEFTVTENAGKVISAAMDRLLARFRVLHP